MYRESHPAKELNLLSQCCAPGSLIDTAVSMAHWVQDVARILANRMNFEHPLVNMPRSETSAYLAKAMEKVPLENFLVNGISTDG